MLSSLLVVSIGLAGGTAIYQSARNMRRELTTEYQLFAENRAFALRDNFEILEDELKRLSLLPQMNMGDGDSMPEQLALAGAHEHSVLYNTAVLLLDETGLCQRAVPDRPEFRGQSFGERTWFRAVRGSGSAEPVFRGTDDPGIGRTIKIIQPIRRGDRFTGALVGVISLSETNLITPTLRDNLPPATDAVLVDEMGEIIDPPDRSRAAAGTGWARAITAALTGATGSLSGQANGQEALFAYSSVRAGTPYVLVFSWPWRKLTTNLTQQAWTLAGILLFGLVLAAIAGLMLSAYLTRPLEALGAGAIRIARGEHVPSMTVPGARTEEVAALAAAFAHMETSIQKRDQQLRAAAEHLEQRVKSRTQELVATQQALVEAERFAAMGKTSAAIAHELKNTLNGLGMAVELIAQDPGNTARVSRLRPQVLGEVTRLRDVVDSLLSFSRSPRVDRAAADLTPVLYRVRELLADLIADRGADVRIEAPDSLPFVCDSHKIQGVLVNLVKNAVDAGHVVRVRAAADERALTLEVADDGPGLSPEARAHLFEPFFTTKPNGTGLGLPTSRRYVEAHGGTLELGAAADLGGALARVRLPREVGAPA
ncbi:MAG TPA: ATP-binding protein [Polyangia bacterium]|nr:ATP-binding protein [Polyangia bacterium]